MQVRLSNYLHSMLEEASADPSEYGLETAHLGNQEFFLPGIFSERFLQWKRSGTEDYYFGKDAPYDRPRGDARQYILHHVHLAPLTSPEELGKWDKSWGRASGRRTSDTALMYVDGGRYGYLLLTILSDPEAHDVVRMKTARDIRFMSEMAIHAKKFMETGPCDF